jgi:hypothetical protein
MSAQEKRRVAALSAGADAKIAAGYAYLVTGRVHRITTSADGSAVIHVSGPGNYVQLALVPKSDAGRRLSLDSTRRVQAWTPECGDDCSNDGGGPPPTQPPAPPPPPNFSSCFGSGGATWYDSSVSVGGCLGPGSGTRQLSCGSWAFTSPGVGRFKSKIGNDDFLAGWVTDRGNGLCDFG